MRLLPLTSFSFSWVYVARGAKLEQRGTTTPSTVAWPPTPSVVRPPATPSAHICCVFLCGLWCKSAGNGSRCRAIPRHAKLLHTLRRKMFQKLCHSIKLLSYPIALHVFTFLKYYSLYTSMCLLLGVFGVCKSSCIIQMSILHCTWSKCLNTWLLFFL